MSNSQPLRFVQNSVHFVHPDVQIAEDAITETRDSAGTCSLSDFRASVTQCIRQVRSSDHPIVITQHGRPTAVVLGIEAYERMLDEMELLSEVRGSEDQADAGNMSEQAQVEVRLRGLLGR